MKLTRSKLQKLIQEELGNILEAHDKDSPSVTRPDEEDYTGHKDDISQTHPGEHDYEDDENRRPVKYSEASDLYRNAAQHLDDLQMHTISGPDGLESVLESFLSELGELGIGPQLDENPPLEEEA